MNLKNTMILLIFILSILGLLLGVYYTEDVNNDTGSDNSFEKIHEEKDGVVTVTLEKKEKDEFSEDFT